MNAVEIEEAVSKLVEESFDPARFPYAFLEAFGNKAATIQRLQSTGKNSTNKTDVTSDGVTADLQRNNIHVATCDSIGPDTVAAPLQRLIDSPTTAKHKAKFVLATDGQTVHAVSLTSDDPPLVCEYGQLADHFGYFLELAGISTVRQIRENAFDIKATGRLNNNSGSPRPASGRGAGGEGLSSVPKFTQIARSYLLHIGVLDWTQINPDIFGSMIQAVADDEERGALGMHYTSVPNILKVLNPLFLDDLHEQLKEADKNPRKLLNLRKRLARIRVFDPACGSGNFLVIAYKQMRAIEAEINILRGEADRASEIPLTNFRRIELRHFAVEVARLALIIAEYQCDELYRGKRLALAEFLPLNKENWITHGNALRLDWLKVCPPTGTGVKLVEDDLFQTPLDQIEIDFENKGGETYICGNPPYVGSTWRSLEQKDDLRQIFDSRTREWKSLDYVAGWFMKAADYGTRTSTSTALVSTNSICQGQQVAILWPLVFATSHQIVFAHTSFKWANLASHNAGVTVVIVGISRKIPERRLLMSNGKPGEEQSHLVQYINAYLISGSNVIVEKRRVPLSDLNPIEAGGKPVDGGHLFLNAPEKRSLIDRFPNATDFMMQVYGAEEYTNGKVR